MTPHRGLIERLASGADGPGEQAGLVETAARAAQADGAPLPLWTISNRIKAAGEQAEYVRAGDAAEAADESENARRQAELDDARDRLAAADDAIAAAQGAHERVQAEFGRWDPIARSLRGELEGVTAVYEPRLREARRALDFAARGFGAELDGRDTERLEGERDDAQARLDQLKPDWDRLLKIEDFLSAAAERRSELGSRAQLLREQRAEAAAAVERAEGKIDQARAELASRLERRDTALAALAKQHQHQGLIVEVVAPDLVERLPDPPADPESDVETEAAAAT